MSPPRLELEKALLELAEAPSTRDVLLGRILAKEDEVGQLANEAALASGPEVETLKMKLTLAKKELGLLRAKMDFARRHKL